MFTSPSKPLNQEQQDLLSFVSASKSLPAMIDSKLSQQLCQQFEINIEQLAQKFLPLAAAHAIVPRSNFYVGAIVIDQDDNLYFGANLELEYGPLTNALHAEQAALFNALRHKCSSLKSLVVNAAPCGYCRQFINEFSDAQSLQVRVNQEQYSFGQLLPHSFGPKDLGQNDGISVQRFQHSFDHENQLAASYAPYSNSPSVLVARQNNQDIAWSAYLENAAFSPSVSPMLLLLSQLQLKGLSINAVDEIQVFERKDTAFSFVEDLQHFLSHYPHLNIETKVIVE